MSKNLEQLDVLSSLNDIKDVLDESNPSNTLKKMLNIEQKMIVIDSLSEKLTPLPQTKFQLTCFDIGGNVFKQGIYATRKRAWAAQRKASQDYGAYLRYELVDVPASQKKPNYVASVGSQYCFCSETPIWADKCTKCGKSPYTD